MHSVSVRVLLILTTLAALQPLAARASVQVVGGSDLLTPAYNCAARNVAGAGLNHANQHLRPYPG